MKKLILFILTMGFSASAVMAAPATSVVPLNVDNAKIQPNQTLSVWYTPLMPNIHYDIKCIIQNPNDAQVTLDIGVSNGAQEWYDAGVFSLNGVIFGENATIPSNSNTNQLLEHNFEGAEGLDLILNLKNLDSSNTVIVKRCAAMPVFGSVQ